MYCPSMNPTRARGRIGIAWRIILVVGLFAQLATTVKIVEMAKQAAATESRLSASENRTCKH